MQHSPPTTTPKPTKTSKRKTDVFQCVFDRTTKIVYKMWLGRNKDRHNPLQRQLRMAKLAEAIRIVEELYSLRTLIMKQHKPTYFAIPLSEMLELSAKRMISWAD